MKSKLNLFIAVLLSAFLFSCGNNTETKNESDKTNEDVTNVNSEDNSEKSNNQTKEDQYLVLSELKDGDTFNNLTLANYEYEENQSFGFTLKGEFEVTGSVMIDEMWGELAVTIEDETNPHNNLIIKMGEFEKPLIQFAYISNANDLRAKLTDKQLETLDNWESVSIKMTIKDFSTGGKLDGYSESYIEFVDIVE